MRKLLLLVFLAATAVTIIAAVVTVIVAAVAIARSRPPPAPPPVLNVYTYDSFASEWGPGPQIKKAFESTCECALNFVAVDGSAGILSRVRLEGAGSRADVVLGLDTSLMAEAAHSGLLAPHNIELHALQVAWRDPVFLPFDYGYFAFMYDRELLASPPRSFRELVDAGDALKIIIQDPRSSTPGLGLMLWVKALYADGAAAVWRKLAGKIVTVTRDWPQAYGMFLNGEADMVLSYTTSQAYHAAAGDDKYRAAAFSEGHGMQIEVAAQLKNAPHPELAQRFMGFILSEEFQSAIPAGNWMYPVMRLKAGLPAAFAHLPRPARALMIDPQRIAANKAKWVDEFSRALSR
ncbi:MAG: thiamine ABC transporter substrate binding subunit [Gammaproteobacteria bacterium]